MAAVDAMLKSTRKEDNECKDYVRIARLKARNGVGGEWAELINDYNMSQGTRCKGQKRHNFSFAGFIKTMKDTSIGTSSSTLEVHSTPPPPGGPGPAGPAGPAHALHDTRISTFMSHQEFKFRMHRQFGDAFTTDEIEAKWQQLLFSTSTVVDYNGPQSTPRILINF